ncbi:hypothetical protein BDV93DRAFT_562540 [Ceratobasidium sp. AG-I]|nr:hypothetical protein BDV93DRAFT_562540 [Ceratobasidium sp. AG-I]
MSSNFGNPIYVELSSSVLALRSIRICRTPYRDKYLITPRTSCLVHPSTPDPAVPAYIPRLCSPLFPCHLTDNAAWDRCSSCFQSQSIFYQQPSEDVPGFAVTECLCRNDLPWSNKTESSSMLDGAGLRLWIAWARALIYFPGIIRRGARSTGEVPTRQSMMGGTGWKARRPRPLLETWRVAEQRSSSPTPPAPLSTFRLVRTCREVPESLMAFAIQTTELDRSSSSDFVTGLACLSTLALATRMPRSTTSSTSIEPPVAPSSFPRPRPLLPAILLDSCLQLSNRRRRAHKLTSYISFLTGVHSTTPFGFSAPLSTNDIASASYHPHPSNPTLYLACRPDLPNPIVIYRPPHFARRAYSFSNGATTAVDRFMGEEAGFGKSVQDMESRLNIEQAETSLRDGFALVGEAARPGARIRIRRFRKRGYAAGSLIEESGRILRRRCHRSKRFEGEKIRLLDGAARMQAA